MAEDLSDPIPTKFSLTEHAFILELKRRTGLSKSEIIRRAIYFFGRECQRVEKAGTSLHAFLGEIGEERTNADVSSVATVDEIARGESNRRKKPARGGGASVAASPKTEHRT